MKTLLPLLVICFFVTSGRDAAAAERTVLARVTAYWRGEGCGLRASWNGARLRNGHCAVDPKRIAFGSKLIFPDAVCTAVDTGPDVVSRKAARIAGHSAVQRNALVIDRFFETREAAITWLRDHPSFMTIRIADADDRRNSGPSSAGSGASFSSRINTAASFLMPAPDPNFGLAALICFGSAVRPT